MYRMGFILFREILEISVLLGIFLAVTKSVPKSRYYIFSGALLGFLSSVLLSLTPSNVASDIGISDDLLNVSINLFVVFTIGWTIIWVDKNNQSLKSHISTISLTKQEASDISSGYSKFPYITLLLLVAGTCFREGAEIVFMIYSVSALENKGVVDYIIGMSFGGLAGIICGICVYIGLFRAVTSYLFPLVTFLMYFIAASFAAHAAQLLTASGIVDIGIESLWDTSAVVSDSSIVGKLLNILFGYIAKPNSLELAFYCSTLIIIFALSRINKKMVQSSS